MTEPSESAPRDYRDTVFLPRADDFPMRAGLPNKEPAIQARWQETGLDQAIIDAGRDRPRFLLHDGPPYANGPIHIGHAANKILKDVVNRSRFMAGYGVHYVQGWDCHGLPIEWKVEERYRAQGKDKDAVPILEFRAECRAFAEHWVDEQSKGIRRLGVTADWPDPYLTMTHAAEAAIVAEIHKFAASGALYQGVRPVLWSVVERTALADAEVEYDEHKSITIWVRFPVVTASRPELDGAAVLIWTTTPWTIPGNRATAYGEDLSYAVYTVEAVAEGSRARVGEKLVLCTALADAVAQAAGIAQWSAGAPFPGADLAGTVLAHPWRGRGYDVPVPMLPGDFVTEEAGTGIVHIAPGHGEDDFRLGVAHGVEVPRTVDADGTFFDHVPLLAGRRVYDDQGRPGDANGAVIKALDEAGALLAKGSLRHQYPHSWRSKAPLIFRTTPQWFISMQAGGLREKALAEIDATRFVPERGKNRIRTMVESRPDWCISRQRSWGVPIALFTRKSDGAVLDDPRVLERIVAIMREEGADAWWRRPAADFLGADYDPKDYEQVFDIVDVWFESGSTHAFVLEARNSLGSPADLYLEGSDQHRGWFQSSLLESVGTRQRAPFKAVLTHGFVLDETGRKMSKSLGNTVDPKEVCDQYGADILRLWVILSDYEQDVRIGPEIIKAQADLYRRLRNTLRYLIGAVEGLDEAERVAPEAMPELERWVLHRLAELEALRLESLEAFDFGRFWRELHDFCATDLSAFYLDIRKDALYCDAPGSPRRRAARTVMDMLFDTLTAWLAPVLVHTAEEAWQARHGEAAGSVHLRRFPETPAGWRDARLAARWERIRRIRRVVTGALEQERAAKRLRSSLEAAPVLWVAEAADRDALAGLDLADLCITSAIALRPGMPNGPAFTLDDVPGVAAQPALAAGEKCARCWKVLPEVGTVADHPALCGRCADAVQVLDSASNSAKSP